MPHRFQGVMTALVTPFTEDDQIDVLALRQLVRTQLNGGVDGLVPCGSTGEAAALSEVEYRTVIRTVVQEVGGHVPVIAGAGSNDTQKAIRLSRIAKETGADALLHVTPYYNKPTTRGLIAHFTAIANGVDLPIIAYNVPGRTGSNVTTDVLLQLIKAVSQVIGVKEASGDLNQIMAIISRTPPEFIVLSGDDALTLPILALGGKGVVSVIANEAPQAFTAMVHAALNGDWATARSLHYYWLDLMNMNFIETNPIPVKTALALMNGTSEALRLPLTPMDQHHRQILTTTLERYSLL